MGAAHGLCRCVCRRAGAQLPTGVRAHDRFSRLRRLPRTVRLSRRCISHVSRTEPVEVSLCYASRGDGQVNGLFPGRWLTSFQMLGIPWWSGATCPNLHCNPGHSARRETRRQLSAFGRVRNGFDDANAGNFLSVLEVFRLYIPPSPTLAAATITASENEAPLVGSQEERVLVAASPPLISPVCWSLLVPCASPAPPPLVSVARGRRDGLVGLLRADGDEGARVAILNPDDALEPAVLGQRDAARA